MHICEVENGWGNRSVGITRDRMLDKPRILIVEDEEGLALTLKLRLTRMGYTPLGPVDTGEQAVEQAVTLRPNLILMDINLAGQMSGIEAARQIRESCQLPVIFLSALDEDSILREAQGSTPYGYLIKPVEERDLRAAIEMALNLHSLEMRLSESEERYRLMFDAMTNGFALLDSVPGEQDDYRYLTLNPAFEHLLRVGPGSLAGKTVRTGLPVIDVQFFVDGIRQVAESGEPLNFERYVPELGRHFGFKIYSPRPNQYAVILEDLTEQKQTEVSLRESYMRLEQELRRTTILREIDQAIITQSDLESMAETVLARMIDPVEIDAAVLFVPENFGTRVTKGHTDMLTAHTPLRMVGEAGFLDGSLTPGVLDWLVEQAARVYYGGNLTYLDLRRESAPGAKELFEMTGFTGCAVIPLSAHKLQRGILQVYRYHVNRSDLAWQKFLQSVATQVAIAIDNMEIMEGLRHTNIELSNAYDATIQALAEALEMRNKESPQHTNRVTELSTRLAETMGITGKQLEHFQRGVRLHDLGKIGIPDRVLLKTGPLSEEDWVTLRMHPELAYRMLAGIKYLEPALNVVYCHHEKWDGSGYPRGLKGEEIPLSARIFAVVDVYDALITDRNYRLAWPKKDVLDYIAREAGRHFDPRVVEVFLKLVG